MAHCTGTDTGNMCYYKYYLSAANTCTKRTKTISSCIGYWYSYDNVHSAEGTPKCKMCEEGKYAVVDLTQTSDSKKYRCKTGDNGIANCVYPGTYIKADGTVIRYCNGCAEKYIGQNYNAFVGAATSCTQNATKTAAITNCLYSGLSAWGTNSCYACKSGYAVNSTGTACTSHTSEKCRQLNTGGTCQECWWPYWFQGNVCLTAFNLAISALATFLLTQLL